MVGHACAPAGIRAARSSVPALTAFNRDPDPLVDDNTRTSRSMSG
jgi:hypothetical protein